MGPAGPGRTCTSPARSCVSSPTLAPVYAHSHGTHRRQAAHCSPLVPVGSKGTVWAARRHGAPLRPRDVAGRAGQSGASQDNYVGMIELAAIANSTPE